MTPTPSLPSPFTPTSVAFTAVTPTGSYTIKDNGEININGKIYAIKNLTIAGTNQDLTKPLTADQMNAIQTLVQEILSKMPTDFDAKKDLESIKITTAEEGKAQVETRTATGISTTQEVAVDKNIITTQLTKMTSLFKSAVLPSSTPAPTTPLAPPLTSLPARPPIPTTTPISTTGGPASTSKLDPTAGLKHTPNPTAVPKKSGLKKRDVDSTGAVSKSPDSSIKLKRQELLESISGAFRKKDDVNFKEKIIIEDTFADNLIDIIDSLKDDDTLTSEAAYDKLLESFNEASAKLLIPGKKSNVIRASEAEINKFKELLDSQKSNLINFFEEVKKDKLSSPSTTPSHHVDTNEPGKTLKSITSVSKKGLSSKDDFINPLITVFSRMMSKGTKLDVEDMTKAFQASAAHFFSGKQKNALEGISSMFMLELGKVVENIENNRITDPEMAFVELSSHFSTELDHFITDEDTPNKITDEQANKLKDFLIKHKEIFLTYFKQEIETS